VPVADLPSAIGAGLAEIGFFFARTRSNCSILRCSCGMGRLVGVMKTLSHGSCGVEQCLASQWVVNAANWRKIPIALTDLRSWPPRPAYVCPEETEPGKEEGVGQVVTVYAYRGIVHGGEIWQGGMVGCG